MGNARTEEGDVEAAGNSVNPVGKVIGVSRVPGRGDTCWAAVGAKRSSRKSGVASVADVDKAIAGRTRPSVGRHGSDNAVPPWRRRGRPQGFLRALLQVASIAGGTTSAFSSIPASRGSSSPASRPRRTARPFSTLSEKRDALIATMRSMAPLRAG